ncbi:hypothetical protein [Amycolatopsis sp. PS_44_ISF1]|uniref:hypothetical protein n=1 Tax=Amycolatopsis sp. PS_44_ISF1 TaxID=2974917 RepID=UPI0028DEADBF|nr:hypothetical protein [Amycolatopsis sp. PS_44_ISF1]MDT8912225.1 hypothetical protein [Amycolatopsis sp. PS_44_ISF1]MDT8913473.1 hypothetical protein [Amycolatopsis sp. PS_44_ISF1]
MADASTASAPAHVQRLNERAGAVQVNAQGDVVVRLDPANPADAALMKQLKSPAGIVVQGPHGYAETVLGILALHVHLDKYFTDLLKKGLTAAGGITGITVALGGGTAAAAIASAIATSLAIVTLCTNEQGELNIYFLNTGFPIPPAPLPVPVCNPFD